MLNSEPVQEFVNSFTVKIQVGTVFRHLRLPAYDPGNTAHRTLSELSKTAHASSVTSHLKEEIDAAAWQVVKVMKPSP